MKIWQPGLSQTPQDPQTHLPVQQNKTIVLRKNVSSPKLINMTC